MFRMMIRFFLSVGTIVTWAVCFFSIQGVYAEDVQVIRYTNGRMGNYVAWEKEPEGFLNKIRTPVIIYAPDPFWQRAYFRAPASEYDVRFVMAEFAKNGYAVLVPMERRQNAESIRGLVYYAHQKYGEKASIYFVGFSEWGTAGLFAPTAENPLFEAMVLIMPMIPESSKWMSLDRLSVQSKVLNFPILVFLSGREPAWALHHVHEVYQCIRQRSNPTFVKSYYQSLQWFWRPDRPYFTEMLAFFSNKTLDSKSKQ